MIDSAAMIDSPAQIGKRLKALRKKNQLTQQAMADALGITQPQWNQYETGKRHLRMADLAQSAA